ncbi:MAG: S41 family peptidase [Chlorobi bacterium]|nr:S41 family peptidase [Chlorobiota bacterium]
MNKNRIHIIWILIAGLSMAAGMWIGYRLSFRRGPELTLQERRPTDKIDHLLEFIRENYVDEVDTDSIVDEVINGILARLDPHSIYIPKRESRRITENMQGNFVGLGVEFQMDRDTFTIRRVLPGSPAAEAGLKAFDQILAIDGDTIAGRGISADSVASRLKGEENTHVKLLVYRPVTRDTFLLSVRRRKVPLRSIPAAVMLNDTLGYVKIDLFSETTYDEFRSALRKLKDKGMRALVLDLRGNSGGYLKEANLVADEFLSSGKLIFYTKNKDNKIRKVYATGRGEFEEGPLYVLIDENTASASEIIAGALQDNDRAVIVGRRSFGKGLVQEEVRLKDGSILRITTSRYYTPSGRSIQTPYERGKRDEYERHFYERYYTGEMFSKDSVHFPDSLQFRTLRGRIVYGGGGIMPDLFVPLTRDYHTDSYRYILLRNYLDEFLRDYAVAHYEDLELMTSSEFAASDTLGPSLYRYVMERTGGREAAYDSVKVRKFQNLLHALLGRDLFGTDIYYRIRLKTDPVIDTVLAHPQVQQILEP